MSLANCTLHMVYQQWKCICGDHGLFPARSSPGTSWTGWVKVSTPDRRLLLSQRTPQLAVQEDCAYVVLIVPGQLELVLPLCRSFWGPATCLQAKPCQMPCWNLWSCGTDHAHIGVSLWWLYYWRAVQSSVEYENTNISSMHHSNKIIINLMIVIT